MTILSAHHSSRIRNRSMGVLHLIAADESCEVSDILALLKIDDLAETPSSTPSQPETAARTSEPATPDVQAEDAAPQPSADPTPEPQPLSTPAVQAHDVEPSSIPLDLTSPSLPGAERAADRAIETGKSVGAKASAAPVKPLTKADIIRADLAEHPNSTAAEIGARTGITPNIVAATARGCKITIRKLDPAERKIAQGKAAATRWAKVERKLKVKPERKPKPVRAAKPPRVAKPVKTELSKADRLQAMFADGAQPTAKEAAQALGYTGQGGVARLAKLLGLTFRKVSAEELSASVREGMKRAGTKLAAKKAETHAALQPSSNVAAPDEPSLKIKVSPSARFYLRNKAGLFVHQSLTPGADGLPMLTERRVYAWFAAEQHYRAILQRFPALSTFRKEGPQ